MTCSTGLRGNRNQRCALLASCLKPFCESQNPCYWSCFAFNFFKPFFSKLLILFMSFHLVFCFQCSSNKHMKSYFLLCSFVHASVHPCVCVYIYVENRGWHWESSSVTSHLYFILNYLFVCDLSQSMCTWL